ncbi:hypothetical protein DZF91_00030 [Actinomadura logoneensis]|uniref:DUF748 domain-containing protein n=1 Tax=Actinomadura logoneensis TaxID=2293572 RepID=A0A372JUJ6_9ACTN|nr:hypothetical protein [Actinomadura logoneensis]RFU43640.1 hypothetical protein DZF91_00100 [Actinomadura logoneensis]RFU43653.1 hypothetical protein DZF91_00030 [Actinomadura logoneensis]
MRTTTRVGAYVLGLAAVFGGALGIGTVTGPVGAKAETGHHMSGGHKGESGEGDMNGEHGGEHGGQGGGQGGAHAGHGGGGTPGGLQISAEGYTLALQNATVAPGTKTDFRFSITGPDGQPVTRYQPLHGKDLHLILARRDLSGFQHLHPTPVGGGVWSVPITLTDAGAYRVFTDVKPVGAENQLTLGADIFAPGDFQPKAVPQPEQVAKVDGYEVTLKGSLTAGKPSTLTLSVSKDGRPVTNLDPYLEAYGHLVALRAGDLAYLHVHPDGEPGDGKTKPGPDVTFEADVPSAGTYRLYLDFSHAGTVHTAEFTAVAK